MAGLNEREKGFATAGNRSEIVTDETDGEGGAHGKATEFMDAAVEWISVKEYSQETTLDRNSQ